MSAMVLPIGQRLLVDSGGVHVLRGSSSKRKRIKYYEVELSCMLCGRVADACGIPEHVPPHPVQLEKLGEPVFIRFRCPTCGGNLAYGEAEQRSRYEDGLEWVGNDGPRRGRPPRWLVEQRLRLEGDMEEFWNG